MYSNITNVIEIKQTCFSFVGFQGAKNNYLQNPENQIGRLYYFQGPDVLFGIVN